MFVRLALEDEVETIVELTRRNVEETKPGEPFDADRVRQVFFRYIDGAHTTVWVVEDKRQIIGFGHAGFSPYDYRAGFFAVQKVIYVVPEKRGTRAAVLLAKEQIAWATRLGADRLIGGNDNSFNTDRTTKFLEHFGFERVGSAMVKRLTGT
ncbi:MAG: putative glucosamine 6-phosphate N-acetyltransferase [Prokaryotic dsDNA virus sp.]|nr:MAG: putative glucosamine 6-phosphate N-acetyltransferase [Prokaryotic dsDNA virus sp.]|tara:strand:- start:5072 stop:5527 length:456 start_codon:yes stop_codon:yes gene_type:complete